MTLSWSPGFCDLGGDEKSPQQCAVGASNGFVVHGLWPEQPRAAPIRRIATPRDPSSVELANARGPLPDAGARAPTNIASTEPARA